MEKIILSEDDKAYCIDQIKNMHQANSFMLELLQKNELPDDFKNTAISLTESILHNVAQKINYKGNLVNKVEERIQKSKVENEKLKTLENMALHKNNFDNFEKKTQKIFDIVNKFWKEEGFGSVFTAHITRYGSYEVELNLCPDLEFPIYEDNEFVKRKTKEDFQEFIVSTHPNYLLIECEKNRSLIEQILKSRFPSVDISAFSGRKTEDEYILNNVKCVIKNIMDIVKLEEGE